MYKNLTITSFLGLTAVILGAFATHALKDKLTAEALQSFETAVKYQMYHVLVLLFVNIFKEFSIAVKNRLTTIFVIGIAFFSGSIYAIYLLSIPAKSIWFITPLGGAIIMIGWILLFYEFFKRSLKK